MAEIVKKVMISHDYGNGTVKVRDAVASNEATTKGQVETLIAAQNTASETYTDNKDTATRSYIDAKILGLGERVGNWDPASGLPTTGSGDGGTIDKNDYWTFSADGTILGETVRKYARLVAAVSNPDTADNTAGNTDWVIEHVPQTHQYRSEFSNVVVPATVQEVLGVSTLEVQTPLANADVLVIGGVTITSGGNLDTVTNTTVAAQATAIKAILEADGTFNTQYGITDDLAGILTITEKVDQATGTDLSHDETGIVDGNIVVTQTTGSVAYDLGDVTITHNLGYQFVQTTITEAGTNRLAEVGVEFTDSNNMKLFNTTDAAITVTGVVSI